MCDDLRISFHFGKLFALLEIFNVVMNIVYCLIKNYEDRCFLFPHRMLFLVYPAIFDLNSELPFVPLKVFLYNFLILNLNYLLLDEILYNFIFFVLCQIECLYFLPVTFFLLSIKNLVFEKS